MNFTFLLPILLLALPLIPALIEIFKRKDKGPRNVPDSTTQEERPEIPTPVPPLERSRMESRANAPTDMVRVTGNVSIPAGTEIDENLVVQGRLIVGERCHFHGSIKALGGVEIGAGTIVEGHIVSDGLVKLGPNCTVNGIIDSVQDIILGENAKVEAVSTKKAVKLGVGAQIRKRVTAGTSILTSPAMGLGPYPEENVGIPKGRKPETTFFPNLSAPHETKRETNKREEIKNQIFKGLERRIDIQGIPGLDERLASELDETEIKILSMLAHGTGVDEIGLELIMAPHEVQKIIGHLVTEHKCLTPDFKIVGSGKRKTKVGKVETSGKAKSDAPQTNGGERLSIRSEGINQEPSKTGGAEEIAPSPAIVSHVKPFMQEAIAAIQEKGPESSIACLKCENQNTDRWSNLEKRSDLLRAYDQICSEDMEEMDEARRRDTSEFSSEI